MQAEIGLEHGPVGGDVRSGEIDVVELHGTHLSCQCGKDALEAAFTSQGECSLNERRGHPDYQPGRGFCASNAGIGACGAIVN